MPKQSAVVPEEMAVAPQPLSQQRGDVGVGGGGGGVSIHRKLMNQLEIGGSRVNSWVDSMRASSPTGRKPAAVAPSINGGDGGGEEEDEEEEYRFWMVRKC